MSASGFAALALGLLQLLVVRTGAIGKSQRIFGQDGRMELDKRARIGQLSDSLAGAKPEVVRALRADLVVPFQLTGVDQLTTFCALDPQVFGDLKIGAFVLRCFGTKFAPALEKIPHRRHGAPFRIIAGKLHTIAVIRTGHGANREHTVRLRRGQELEPRSADRASWNRPLFWRWQG